MTRSTSLLRRITVRISLMTLVMMAALYGWVYYQIIWAADRANEGSLIAQTHEILDNVTESDGTIHFQLPDDLETPADETHGIFRYSVRDETGAVLFSSAWPTTARTDGTAFAKNDGLYQTDHSQPFSDEFIGSKLSKTLGAHRLVVQAERSTDDLDLLADTLLNEFFLHGAWFAIPLLCVLLLIIAYTIRGAIAPLNALSREATRIGPSSTDLRLAETNVPAEILPLVKAMNSVLDRLDAGFRLQREFTADAAHELRTPLAILRAQVEMIGNPDLTSSLTEDIDALSRVITQLLRDAQLGALDISSSDIADLAEIADETAELMRPLTIRDGKTIVVQRPSGPVLVYGNKEAIANAMRNLVENARRYTPHDRAVEIIIDPSGRADIRDHGPGIAPEDKAKIFTRFWRRNSADGGAGLGLSIVKKTMDLHGGAIAVAPTPAGGATFSLSFRLVSFL